MNNERFAFGVLKCGVQPVPVYPREVHKVVTTDTRFRGKKYVGTITETDEGEYTWEARNAEGQLMYHGSGVNLEKVKQTIDNRSRIYFGRLEMGRQMEELRVKKRPNVKTDAGLATLKALAIDISAGARPSSDQETLAESVHDLINEVRALRRSNDRVEHDRTVYVDRTAKMMFLNKDKSNTEAEWDNLNAATREKWKEAAAKFLGIRYFPTARVEDRFLP